MKKLLLTGLIMAGMFAPSYAASTYVYRGVTYVQQPDGSWQPQQATATVTTTTATPTTKPQSTKYVMVYTKADGTHDFKYNVPAPGTYTIGELKKYMRGLKSDGTYISSGRDFQVMWTDRYKRTFIKPGASSPVAGTLLNDAATVTLMTDPVRTKYMSDTTRQVNKYNTASDGRPKYEKIMTYFMIGNYKVYLADPNPHAQVPGTAMTKSYFPTDRTLENFNVK